MRSVQARHSHPFQILLLVLLAACETAPDTTTGSAGITMDPATSMSVTVGGVDTVTATVTGLAPGVTYNSSNPAVATVNATGVVTGVTLGNATITAIATANPAVTGSITVTVGTIIALTHSDSMDGFIEEVCPNEEEGLLDSLDIEADLPMVHEFHDCQRLSQNNEYRSLVGIFAHRNVDTYVKPEDFEHGRLAALIINFETKDRWEAYEPLGLAPGVSCLVIRWQKPLQPNRRRTDGWEAAIIPRTRTSSSYGDCPPTLTWDSVPNAQKGLLDMVPQRNAASPNGGSGSPPVARWDWDSIRSVNTIGVRCGEKGWCEIGKVGFAPLEALKTSSGKNIFKGYYDQQYLAAPNGARSDVWGTLVPGKHALVTGVIKRSGTWYEAVRIDMDAPASSSALGFYVDKMKLIQSTTTGGKQRAVGSLEIRSKQVNDPVIGKNWHLRVNQDASVAQGVMDYRSHPNEPSRFATVRWRWNDLDETVWTYCPEDGCCEMRRLL